MPKWLLIFIFIASGGLLLDARPANNANLDGSLIFASANEADLGEALEGNPQPYPVTPYIAENPAEELDDLSSRANDWHEPSPKSELRYVFAIRKWLDTLAPDKQEKARKILREAHPGMHALRVAIRNKKKQLEMLNFNSSTRPDTLPRLGQELNELRSALRTELSNVGERLRKEAGITMGPLGGDGFWLAPPSPVPYVDTPVHNSRKRIKRTAKAKPDA